MALTAVGFVPILPSGFEALLCHCPGLQREPLKAVRDHWRSQGGLELEGVEGEAALEDQLIDALEAGRPTRCLLDRPADLFPRNRKLIDRLVVIADDCSCNPLLAGFLGDEVLLVRAWPRATGRRSAATASV